MIYRIHNRWLASSAHLLISVVIFVLVLALTYLLWFPRELIHAGAITGLQIIVGVDLVLGPLLTLIVFDLNKKNLKFDLLVIALIQLSCLTYGLWLLQNERPVAQVLADDGVYLISKAEFKEYELSMPASKSHINPPAFILGLPNDWSSLPALKLTTKLVSERPFAYREDLYESFDSVGEHNYNLRVDKILENLGFEMKQRDDPTTNCRWLPVYSKHTSGSACINFESGIVRLSEHVSMF